MIKNQEAIQERMHNLGEFNGIALLLVTLQPQPNPSEAVLTVQFANTNHVADLLAAAASPAQARAIFPITGGFRLKAGPQSGQVQVVSVAGDADPRQLNLSVRPIGDYSTYTLAVAFEQIDPLLGEIEFKFRPGCFNNCPPDWTPPPAPRPTPPISYLAKDYDSFRHVLLTWMAERVPDWQPTSEADFDQVLIDLFSAVGDELSDFQDRVMNEAYLLTARKRLSLARHARLVDYHIHQGNQAATWLALKVNTAGTLVQGFRAATLPLNDPARVEFRTREAVTVDPLLNDLHLYTWSDAIPALAAGSLSADLELEVNGQAAAESVRDLIRAGQVNHLLLQEQLNPLTGLPPGADPTHRQLLRLLPGEAGAEARQDPLLGRWFVRVYWQAADRLQRDYCFVVDCPTGKVRDVSLFHGNLVEAYAGEQLTVELRDAVDPLLEWGQPFYQRQPERDGLPGGALGPLPGLLAYRNTPPGGDIPPRSTVEVSVAANGSLEPWQEVIDLVHSAEHAAHFAVETDELGRSTLRFGNDINGRALPPLAVVRAAYQVGRGLDGNVGRDSLTDYDALTFGAVTACWNPFDAVDGRSPEPAAQILRRAPEAYRYRQLRAVTLQDYVDRAEELPGVQRAAAAYAWTGSWRTVRVTVDPLGATILTDELRQQVARQLDAVRLIGEDLEIRPPLYVPLDIQVTLCARADTWPADLRFELEQEFSDGYTRAGELAFFHPDRWTFGMPLHVSQILGRVQRIPGVDHVIRVRLRRMLQPDTRSVDPLVVRANEIILVKNDPDHRELGAIQFDIQGGRA